MNLKKLTIYGFFVASCYMFPQLSFAAADAFSLNWIGTDTSKSSAFNCKFDREDVADSTIIFAENHNVQIGGFGEGGRVLLTADKLKAKYFIALPEGNQKDRPVSDARVTFSSFSPAHITCEEGQGGKSPFGFGKPRPSQK